MKLKTFLKVLFVLLIFTAIFLFGMWKNRSTKDDAISKDTKTINIWYTDVALTDYLNSVALSFYEENGIRVVPYLHEGAEYVETMYEASNNGENVPDLYIIGTDTLEKDAMAGIAIPVTDPDEILNTDNYSNVSLDAVTYDGHIFAYPMYFETAYLLFNRTYLEEIADTAVRIDIIDAMYEGDEETDYSKLTDEATSSDGAIPEGYTEDSWREIVAQKTEELIPDSIGDILSLAEKYSAPSEVDNIFIWDVTDIFYNYFFAGAYMNIGGQYGDDSSIIDINTEDAKECLTVYQSLNQFFYIDTAASSYTNVLDDFMNGKTLFTIATTDAIAKIEAKKNAGEFEYEYGVYKLPGVDEEHNAKGLSSTSAVVINPYASDIDAANTFASYLVQDTSESMYNRTGKLPANTNHKASMDDNLQQIYELYSQSASLPKLIKMSNFWMELENTYMLIWDGADVGETLDNLSDKMVQKY